MKEAALILFGAIIGFFIGRFQSFLDRLQVGRNTFRECIADLHASLDSCDLDEMEFFERSLPVLRREVRRVSRFVRAKSRARLNEAMKRYDSHHPSEFASGITRAATAFKSGKSHKERLHEMLDEFVV
jgi:hypothetical protein